MEASFLELKAKQVINTVDGKCLGHISDIIFDVVTACALGFVVPAQNRGFLGLFKGAKDIFIPFDCVCKIGVDVILVELYIENESHHSNKPNHRDSKCCSVDLNKNNKQINNYKNSQP